MSKLTWTRRRGTYADDFTGQIKSDKHSIIFSCWTRTLQLLSKYLNQHHISYVLIDGSCSLTERQTRLDLFADDKETPVLIMTTGTGGFGCVNRLTQLCITATRC